MSDFSHYKIISGKLKKRFLLRKPNLHEASDQFLSLSRDLREFKAYSGYCLIAVARCQHSLNNTNNELHSLLESARLFRDGQQINGAISSYRHALRLCDPSLKTPICAELAQMYIKQKRYIEASHAFIDGNLFREAADSYLSAAQFEMALDSFNKLDQNSLNETDFITIFLLKLYLNDANKYDFQLPVIECHPENDELMDLNIMLESLLISMKSKCEDENEIRNSIASQLFPKLNGHQNELIYLIITEKSD
jgi:hypothetical protein